MHIQWPYFSDESVADAKMFLNVLVRRVVHIDVEILEVFRAFRVLHGSEVEYVRNCLLEQMLCPKPHRETAQENPIHNF